MRKYPDSILVSFKGNKYTYAQVAYIAEKISHKLSSVQVKPGENIAILVPRSQWYIIASLGVLTFGAAYVPIDDGFPDNRIAFMLKDTSATVVLVTSETRSQVERILSSDDFNHDLHVIEVDKLDTEQDISEIDNNVTNFKYYIAKPKDNAFIVYTSGTTGKPKAIQITRIGILNCAEWYVKFSQMKQTDIYALYSSFVFDMHMVGFYTSIICGATVDIVPAEVRLDVASLNSYFVDVGATHTYLPTQIGRIFASRDFETPIKFLLVIGEKLGEIKAPENYIMCESYGPTETLTFVTAIKVSDRKYSCSIGRPIANTKVYVLDKNKCKVPDGEIGELYISTKQCSNGYINRLEENKQAFFSNQFDSDIAGYELMYKTGDMVKILPDGTIGFIGRKDSQVKIRGNRVELIEVESTIRELEFIEDTTTSTINNHGNLELVAYVVLNCTCKYDITSAKKKIISHIKAHKPSYMIPSYIEVLDKIPVNVNGKIDKRALPAPDKTHNSDTPVKPNTTIEAKLLKNACEALEICEDNIGINTDLRQCGLDSVSALRVTYVWKDKCNIDCSAYEILKYGSVEKILKNCKINVYQPIQVPYKSSTDKTLFFVHPRNSSSISFTNLMKGFSHKFNFACIENYNFYHLDNPIRGYKNFAKLYIKYLRDYQAHGPYYLGGWSLGGCIAYEMAKILLDQGEEVKKLYLLDPVYAKNSLNDNQIQEVAQVINNWYFGSKWSEAITKPFSDNLLKGYMAEYKGQVIDEFSYCPSFYDGPVTFFKASEKCPEVEELAEFKNTDIDKKNLPEAVWKSSIDKPANGFENYISDLKIVHVPTEHDNLMFEEPARFIAKVIEEDMDS